MLNENLFKAVATGNVEEAQKALTAENINASTYYGAKSIVLAAKQGNSEILKMLLENSEKVNRESFWRRSAQAALLGAVCSENMETVKLLLEYGAGADKKNLRRAPDFDGLFPFPPSEPLINRGSFLQPAL
jgi:ankyrin repeat protein